MRFKGNSAVRVVLLAGVFGVGLFCSGCGDVFRPVANPVFQPGGDPQRTRHALVVSPNIDPSQTGSAVVIDVSGDDVSAVFSGLNPQGVNTGVGRNPVFATNISGTDYVVNRDDNSLSSFLVPIPPNPLNPPTQISLPNLSPSLCPAVDPVPVFAAFAQTKLFVAESARNCVAVIAPGSNADTAEIPVGRDPVALVPTPDGTRLYVLNKSDGTVSLIFPATNQPAPSAITVGASPVWGVASNDSSRVFVVNQGAGTVSVIDTTAGPTSDTVISTLAVGAAPNYIVYQTSQNRAYVISPTDKSLSIIQNATGTAPSVTVVSLTGTPCNGFPISVTALANGTRAYVADRDTNTVCVLDTTSNQFIRSITNLTSASAGGQPLPAAPVFIASDSDSMRVYTANSGSGDISIIDTTTDTTVKQSDGTTPLTICAGPLTPGPTGSLTCPRNFIPNFIAMTP